MARVRTNLTSIPRSNPYSATALNKLFTKSQPLYSNTPNTNIHCLHCISAYLHCFPAVLAATPYCMSTTDLYFCSNKSPLYPLYQTVSTLYHDCSSCITMLHVYHYFVYFFMKLHCSHCITEYPHRIKTVAAVSLCCICINTFYVCSHEPLLYLLYHGVSTLYQNCINGITTLTVNRNFGLAVLTVQNKRPYF